MLPPLQTLRCPDRGRSFATGWTGRAALVRLALLLGLLPTLLLCAPPRVTAGPLVSPLELARRITPDPSCTRVQIQGPCFCGARPCGLRVRMYVPVALVETVRAPGDSLLAVPGAAVAEAAGTVSSSHAALDNTAEAHAWLLGNAAWLFSGQLPCLRCQPSDARLPPPPASTLSDWMCDPASAVVQALTGNVQSGLGPLLPSLAYASEADAVNWRTGCRDLLAIDTWSGQLAAGLGRWGPLYPRQMRDLGTPPVVYSAKTAYRALSIAREQLGTFPFPVDLAGRMQQAYPAVSTCFDIGEQPLPQAPASERPVATSGDGRYAWFYWRPVSCCVGFESLARCASGAALPR